VRVGLSRAKSRDRLTLTLSRRERGPEGRRNAALPKRNAPANLLRARACGLRRAGPVVASSRLPITSLNARCSAFPVGGWAMRLVGIAQALSRSGG